MSGFPLETCGNDIGERDRILEINAGHPHLGIRLQGRSNMTTFLKKHLDPAAPPPT